MRELWWLGLPPGVRGGVWRRAIGNDLNISPGEGETETRTLSLFVMNCFPNRVVSNLPYSVSRETGIHEAC